MVDIRAVTAESREALGDLFSVNRTVAGCGCMYFVLDNSAVKAGWNNGSNRARLLADAAMVPPIGLLAFDDDDRPVGWVAAGPRSRYARAMGSALYAGRNSAEDGSVWFLPCLFVRPGSRRKGVAAALLTTAVDTARTYGATAVEGFPLAGGEKRASGDAYLGTEAMFLAAGFEVDRRPSAKRVIMRLTLAP